MSQDFLKIFKNPENVLKFQENTHLGNYFLPSLLDRSLTSPARQVSVTSEMFDAHRPIACIVEATNCLSELVM